MIKMHSRLKKSKCRECEDEIFENDLFYYDPAEEDPYKRGICLDCGDLDAEQLDAKLAKLHKSTNDLSTPMQDCANENCTNQTSTKQYFCKICKSKLPESLQSKVNQIYTEYLKNRKFIIAKGDLVRVYYQCIEYLK